MSAPVGLLAASTLLWGWLCELMVVAIPLAVLLEGWRFSNRRWDLSARDFQRIADLCTWAFVLLAGYLIVAKGWPLPILQIVEWLPLVLAPLMLAQLYSSAGRIELSALFLSLRADAAGVLARERVDLAFAYAAICVLAAGAANVRTPWYFAAAAALALWGLWNVRSRRYPLWLWIGMATFTVAVAYAGHHGLSRLQTWIFNIAIEYLRLDLARADPYRATTDIGQIGELKSSDRILLRVTVSSDVGMPLLLHRASYDMYAAATWFAKDGQFNEQLTDDGTGRWSLSPRADAHARIAISEVFPGGVGVLALPAATATVAGLGQAVVMRNRFGTVRVERAPGMVAYTAEGDLGRIALGAPLASDRQLPAQEAAELRVIADRLRLSSLPAADVAPALKAFFAEGFRYSTFRSERVAKSNAITEFLLHSRAGHCEYFATATVLLARAAGIPARYATGFSVQEFSAIEGRHIVRERHAHAWARLYLNGAWHDIDTTPPQWFAQEAQSAPLWEPLTDFGSWLGFAWAEWRARPADDETALAWYAALAILACMVLWRFYRGGFARARGQSRSRAQALNGAADLPFREVERRMTHYGLPRLPMETPSEWLRRIGPRFAQEDRDLLAALLRWHYRDRFDPLKMSPRERQAYARATQRWLARDPAPRPAEMEP